MEKIKRKSFSTFHRNKIHATHVPESGWNSKSNERCGLMRIEKHREENGVKAWSAGKELRKDTKLSKINVFPARVFIHVVFGINKEL